MYNPQAEHIIRQELIKSARPFTEKRRDFATLCINSSCPSLQTSGKYKLEIRKDGSKAHCWVCDWSGSWDSFAKSQGLQTLKNGNRGFSKESYQSNVDIVQHIHAQLVADVKETENKQPGVLPSGLIPWAQYTNHPWRGLSVEFLTSLDARFWQHDYEGHITPRILLPYYQHGALVGYTGRRLDQIKFMKYCNAEWTPAKKLFYPYDYVASTSPRTIVLVEGQIDALNLIQYGIPALCIMGTNNWSDAKRSKLQELDIDRVFICMDGDSAGRLAATQLLQGTERHGSLIQDKKGIRYFQHVENINLPDGTDPGDLAQDQLAWLKNYIGV